MVIFIVYKDGKCVSSHNFANKDFKNQQIPNNRPDNKYMVGGTNITRNIAKILTFSINRSDKKIRIP